jgi:thiol-disulfide isomerase/thioredoxin
MKKILVRAAGVAAVVALAALSLAENPKGAKIDPPRPAKSFPITECLQMRPTKDPLKSLRGRVVLLTFFGTYYERCAAAVPDLVAMNDRLGPRGLSVLFVTADEERATVEKWLQTNGVKWGAVIADTETKEKLLLREYPAPGYPWTWVIDAKGNMVLHDHPQGLKDAVLEPYLDDTTAPPVMPETFAQAQQELDAGTWAKAKATLQAAVEGGKLSKVEAGWAKGVAKWIDMRRPKVLAEAEDLRRQGWHWDAWATWDDFQRRFEGMEGCDVAKAKAEEVRKDPAAADDLKNGDDLVKAKDFLAQKKTAPAKLILERLSKLKTSRFSERAKELLPTVK